MEGWRVGGVGGGAEQEVEDRGDGGVPEDSSWAWSCSLMIVDLGATGFSSRGVKVLLFHSFISNADAGSPAVPPGVSGGQQSTGDP